MYLLHILQGYDPDINVCLFGLSAGVFSASFPGRGAVLLSSAQTMEESR